MWITIKGTVYTFYSQFILNKIRQQGSNYKSTKSCFNSNQYQYLKSKFIPNLQKL